MQSDAFECIWMISEILDLLGLIPLDLFDEFGRFLPWEFNLIDLVEVGNLCET